MHKDFHIEVHVYGHIVPKGTHESLTPHHYPTYIHVPEWNSLPEKKLHVLCMYRTTGKIKATQCISHYMYREFIMSSCQP